MSAPLPPDEAKRLRALLDYELLDTEPEPQLDDLALLASRICGTPIAAITLIDESRQWFKSKVGFTESGIHRDLAFCTHTILQTDVLVVEDALADPRFASNPLVNSDPKIRFYAGSPLVTPDGHAIGSLCVFDLQPHVLNEEQRQALRALGRQVVAQFELRRRLLETRAIMAQLERSEESLRLLGSAVEQTREAVVITDAELDPPGPRIVFVNPAFTRMTGYTAEECANKTPRILQGPLTDAATVRRLRQQLELGGEFNGESINYRKDGSPYHQEWHIAPIRNPAGTVTHFVSVLRDVTERKRAEEALAESRETLRALNAELEERVARRTGELFAATLEAQQANAAKTEFLSRTSHELRTPLNAILGFSQLLEMEADLDLEPRESVEQILRAGRHLLSMIDEVLDIANTDSDTLSLTLAPVAVPPLIEETLNLVRTLAHQLGVELEVARPAECVGEVLADRQRLKQVLLNLLGNAIKYNRPGGRVSLEWVGGGTAEAPTWRLGVKDTGPGISPEKIARLFTPFDRLDAQHTYSHVAGTGLGLAVSKRMVEVMGGSIGVQSEPGTGSTFWIELPAATGRCPVNHGPGCDPMR